MAPGKRYQRSPRVRLRNYDSDDYCEFELLDTDVSVANALRRIIISHVSFVSSVQPLHVLLGCAG